LLGDEGSGFWLGREAIATYLRVLERRTAPGLLAALVASTLGANVRTVPDVIAWVNTSAGQVERLASLAPLVSWAAESGDALALDTLCRAGQALAELVVAAAHQVWPAVLPEMLAVACCGGVWTAGQPLAMPFVAALRERLPGAVTTPPLLPAVGGAVLLALGNPSSSGVVDRLRQSFSGG
jgi:N-acetylglucosamine kinase-like BadF-type ATPase